MRVSQIERGQVATIDAFARYIEALGGRLDLVASFGDHTSPWPPPKRMTASRSPQGQSRPC